MLLFYALKGIKTYIYNLSRRMLLFFLWVYYDVTVIWGAKYEFSTSNLYVLQCVIKSLCALGDD